MYISTGAGAKAALTDDRVAGIIERMRPALRASEYANALQVGSLFLTGAACLVISQ